MSGGPSRNPGHLNKESSSGRRTPGFQGRGASWRKTKSAFVTIHVTSRTPLHTLRKEFGSQINSRFGLTAAQEMLRHANIHTTAAHYVENKQRSVLGFAHLLKSDQRTIVALAKATQSLPRI
jgi:integrase